MTVMKTHVRSLASFAAAFAAAASPLFAQSADVLAPSGNAAFLEGLWRYNYIEQAKKVGDLVEASNLPESEKKAVAEIYRRLKIALSIKNDDAIARRDLVLQGLNEKAAQLRSAEANSEAAVQLMSEYIEQFRLLADALVGAFAQEAPEKVTEARKTYDELFTAAEAEFEAAKKAGETHRDDAKPGSEIPLLVAYYGLGRLYYYHSLIHPDDSLLGKRKAEQALTTLEEFDLEFSDTFTAYEAKLTQALAHKRLGNLEAAMGACDDAIRLREAFGEKDKNGVWSRVEPEGADVISAAVLQKTLFLADDKNHTQIVEVANDYLKNIPAALDAMRGKDVLVARASAYVQLGDNIAAKKDAEQLMEFGGQWAGKGSVILAELSDVGPPVGDFPKTLRLAESEASRKEFERALKLCRDVQRNATAPEDEKFAAEAMLITGAIYATRQWFHEASVAFDAVVRRYPKSEVAPDALYRSLVCFNELYSSDKAPMFKRFADERGKQLVTDYPTHPRVASLQLTEGQQLERAKKFLEAAKAYETISADSSVYQEARYRAAVSYHKHARSLAGGGQQKEAEQFSAKAQQGFESLLPDLENAIAGTTDAAVKRRLTSIAFDARVDLANLLLASNAKVEEVEKVLAKLDPKPENEEDSAIVWALQIRTKLAKGEVDAAAAQMEGALGKVGDKQALVITARSLAVAMDNQAVELDKNKQYQQAQGVWRKAAGFYVKSAAVATVTEATQIADRLRVIGMIENKLDDKVETWFELSNTNRVNSEAWSGAAQIYRRMIEGDTGRVDHRVLIGLARVLGFQSQWNEAEEVLTRLFTQEKIVAANKRLDSAALSRKPELLTAYLEHGFVLPLPTTGDDKSRRAKATDIFERVVLSVPADSRHWWHAKHGQIRTLFERGLYDQAEVAMNSLERNNPDFDLKDGKERFGLAQKLKLLKQSIAEKVKRK